jgi:hypothetical protein
MPGPLWDSKSPGNHMDVFAIPDRLTLTSIAASQSNPADPGACNLLQTGTCGRWLAGCRYHLCHPGPHDVLGRTQGDRYGGLLGICCLAAGLQGRGIVGATYPGVAVVGGTGMGTEHRRAQTIEGYIRLPSLPPARLPTHPSNPAAAALGRAAGPGAAQAPQRLLGARGCLLPGRAGDIC